MQQIQSHEIKDIYRIREGLLVEITKYKSLGEYSYNKRKEKRVRGCKGLTILTEDYTYKSYAKGEVTFPKGTYFYHNSPVQPITDITQFKAEIKSSGGSVLGSIKEIKSVLWLVEEILDNYK